MSFHSWLQNLRSALPPRSSQVKLVCRGSRRAATHRLRLEGLEDRRLLAFLAPVDYAVGVETYDLVVEDFNNDTVQDIAVGTADNKVRVLLGNGDGSFQPGPECNTGVPYSLAVGDFDRDGNLDMAVAQLHGVTVMLGNGEGAFEAASSIYSAGEYLAGVAVGDFNGDGLLDLGVTSVSPSAGDMVSYGYAEVLLGNGDGSFSGPNITPLDWANWLYGPAVADLNGDGFDDLVTTADSRVLVLLGGSAGSLQGPFSFSTGEDSPGPPAAGDLDADGDIDLVTASWDGDNLNVLLGDGAGGFSAATNYEAGYRAWVELGDFTGDGNLDVAHSQWQNLSVFPGRGDGMLAPSIDFAMESDSRQLAVGDFNGDGWLDAVLNDYSNHAVSVLINDQSWQSPPLPTASISDRSVTEGNTGTASATFTVSLSSPSPVDVTVHYTTSSGTASAGSDYQAASGTLTILAGQATGTITVLVNGDRLVEANETFFVVLSGATGAAIGDGQSQSTITDDEPRISISDVTQYEGRNGKTQFTFTVTLSVAYDQPVTMSYRTVTGTATTSNNDYVAKTGTLTFAKGETSKTITIDVRGDSNREANEAFYLDLFGNSNSQLKKSRGIGTILNDD